MHNTFNIAPYPSPFKNAFPFMLSPTPLESDCLSSQDLEVLHPPHYTFSAADPTVHFDNGWLRFGNGQSELLMPRWMARTYNAAGALRRFPQEFTVHVFRQSTAGIGRLRRKWWPGSRRAGSLPAGKSRSKLPTAEKSRSKSQDQTKNAKDRVWPSGHECYVEPLTGSKFYSKPQVSEYLKNKKPSTGEFFGGETSLKVEASCNMKTLEGASCASEQKERGVINKSVKKIVIERAIPDGLPAGWVKETKIQKRNGIRKDPYYTDPVSGYVFRSVPDALRYLESGNISRCAIKPRKRHELSFLDEETSVKPPSAAKMQHSGHHSTKAQLEGMENSVTNKGLEKRQCPTVSADATIPSMAEHSVNRAIEECAESECSNDPSRSHLPRTEGSKRKLWDRVNEKNGTDQLAVNVVGSTSDRKMLINSRKTKKQEAVNLPRRSSKRLMGTKPEMVVSLGLSERDLIAAARNAEAKLLVHSVPQRLETFSGAEIANHVFTGTEAPLDAKQSNRRNKPLKNEAFPEASQGTDEEHEADVESKILNPVGDSWSDPCLDFAVKILTGTIEIEEETKETNDPGSSPLTRASGCNGNQCEMVCAENGTVSFQSPDMVEEGKLAENGLGMKRSRKMQINSSKSKNKEALSLPRRSSNRLAGLNPSIAVNFPLCQRVPASAKSGESAAAKQSPEAHDNLAHTPEALDNVAQSAPQLFETVEGSKKPIEDKAVQEDQPVRQETEKKNVENPESQFLYPLEDSWSDLCIEFAVKTLTGEIPIEDNIAFQDYFQQLDDTSHTLPDLGLPNSFQTDILSDFDSTGNPVSRTQLPDIPTFPFPGNVDSTVDSDNAPQQPILRGKEEQNQTTGKS
ncbi:methyl-CpG-binding domain-containing protein 13-like [Rhododendron vialii]|uniref:methyl-CpG-binding domain-containing protein 13-like n=1 Tax=Rhododendron vialii TaxID=182163 RepID=UPI0026604EC3|nr:methyl-CpG-binding domain-containing protein 13-like [Rhododendron vialii]